MNCLDKIGMNSFVKIAKKHGDRVYHKITETPIYDQEDPDFRRQIGTAYHLILTSNPAAGVKPISKVINLGREFNNEITRPITENPELIERIAYIQNKGIQIKEVL